MRNVYNLTFGMGTLEAKPVFRELAPADGDDSLGAAERLIAMVGAWLAERFAGAPTPLFIEDGRIAALLPPRLIN